MQNVRQQLYVRQLLDIIGVNVWLCVESVFSIMVKMKWLHGQIFILLKRYPFQLVFSEHDFHLIQISHSCFGSASAAAASQSHFSSASPPPPRDDDDDFDVDFDDFDFLLSEDLASLASSFSTTPSRFWKELDKLMLNVYRLLIVSSVLSMILNG